MLQHHLHAPETALISARDLLSCDYVGETLVQGLIKSPLDFARCLRDALRSGHTLETSAAKYFQLNASALLYDPQILQQIADARDKGLKISLLTDMPENWRRAIALHHNLSDQTLTNSQEAITTPKLTAPAAVARLPALGSSPIRTLLSSLRLYQWPKNALVLLPILLSHRFNEISLLVSTLLAFVAFGLAASSIYVLNDLLDVRTDRQHPSKRHRAFASGAIPVRLGLLLSLALLSGSVTVALSLPPIFMVVLVTYIILNFAYTTYLKRKLLVDVLALAGSYTLRILAGNAATGIELSFWLLAFSIFLFFSLALVKRYVEMDTIGVKQPCEKRVMGRGYRYADLDMLSQMGVASAFSAVLVLALYVERAGATGLYTRPELIWLICPIVLYVISRIWFLAKRGEMKDDPVEFILRDWRSHIMGMIVAAIMISAST